MELVQTLHCPPLVITQAAAYIREEDVSLTHYLDLLQDDSNDDILEQDYYDHARHSEIQNVIFLAWQISFEQIRRQKP